MTKKEIIELCIDYLQDGLSEDEVIEWIVDNTKFNPEEIMTKIYKKQAFI